MISVPAEFTSKSNQTILNQLIKGWNLTLQDCRSPCERFNALGWIQINIFVLFSSCAHTQTWRSRCPSLLTVNLFAYSPSVRLFPICSSPAFMMLTKTYNYSQTVHLSDCCSFRSVQSYEAINEAEERMNKIPINQINHSGHFWLLVSAAAH